MTYIIIFIIEVTYYFLSSLLEITFLSMKLFFKIVEHYARLKIQNLKNDLVQSNSIYIIIVELKW